MMKSNTTGILILLLALTVSDAASSSGKDRSGSSRSLKLLVPERVEAFTSDVRVDVVGGERHAVVKLFYEDEKSALAGQVITQTPKRVSLIFDCGHFIRAGSYIFKYYRAATSKAASTTAMMPVVFPPMRVDLKTTAQLYTSDSEVTVSFPPSVDVCRSSLMRSYRTEIALMPSPSSSESSSSPMEPVRQTLDRFPPDRPAIFECDSPRAPGRYRAVVSAVLTSADDGNATLSSRVAVGTSVRFQHSSRYDIELDGSGRTAGACDGRGVSSSQLRLVLRKPPCAPSSDRVRMSVVYGGGKADDDVMTVDVGQADELSFPCVAPPSDEKKPPPAAVCFSYMSSEGDILRKKCFPTPGLSTASGGPVQVDGGWSTWTGWSSCHRPCNHTLRRRHRNCDNPRPLGGGRKCKEFDRPGRYEIKEEAGASCLISSYEDDEERDDPMKRWRRSRCECGCYVSARRGDGLIVSPVTGQCDDEDRIVWVVSTPPRTRVRFTVLHYDVGYGEYVTVTERSSGDGGERATVSFPSTPRIGFELRSTGSEVEMVYSRSGAPDVCGFTLKYSIEDVAPDDLYEDSGRQQTPPPTATLSGMLEDEEELESSSSSASSAVIVGVSVCSSIILLAVVVSCRRHRAQRKAKQERLKSERRIDFPPDGKSSSDMDEHMERRPMFGNVDSPVTRSVTGTSLVSPQPAGAYYLAQRQLQLMKKIGTEGSTQVYEASVLQIPNIRDQEDLLFGDTLKRDKSRGGGGADLDEPGSSVA